MWISKKHFITGFSFWSGVADCRKHCAAPRKKKAPGRRLDRIHGYVVRFALGANAPMPMVNSSVARLLRWIKGALRAYATAAPVVISGTEIFSRGGSKGRLEKFRQTWWCLVLTETVLQGVFDLSLVGRE